MTVDQLLRECQKLKLNGCGDFTVMLSDLTDEPPVPQSIGSVKILKNCKKVFLQSETVNEMVARVNKMKQDLANGSKC